MTAPVIDYATPLTHPKPQRLISLDVFRGLVIFAMLLVNNLGDGNTTGYFWKHADWPALNQRQAWKAWWTAATGSTSEPTLVVSSPTIGTGNLALAWDNRNPPYAIDQATIASRAHDEAARIADSPWSRIPLFTHCTLADYVMPSFMLIIGVAIPFSLAAARARGIVASVIWFRTIKRAILLVILGWILCYFRDQFAASLRGERPWTFSFGMDVLQLLGVGYLVARILYALPSTPRAIAAALLLIWHWAILRFYPQGVAPAGTFTEHYEAIGYIYRTWPIWNATTLHLGPVSIGWVGMMSVPPAAATMLIGTLIGDWLNRNDITPREKVSGLASAGLVLAIAGFLWAFDLPFNKPRWSPCYLVYVSGVGAMLIALLYNAIDIRQSRSWVYPAIVFGSNAIAVYFLSILLKVLLLNTPRLDTSHHGAMVATKYGTLIFCTIVILLVAWKLIHWARTEVGRAAWGILMVVLLPLTVMWVRFVTQPVQIAQSGATTLPAKPELSQIGTQAIAALKLHLGPYAGGWLFTFTFIAFWWLVLDQMHRRRIFWKL